MPTSFPAPMFILFSFHTVESKMFANIEVSIWYWHLCLAYFRFDVCHLKPRLNIQFHLRKKKWFFFHTFDKCWHFRRSSSSSLYSTHPKCFLLLNDIYFVVCTSHFKGKQMYKMNINWSDGEWWCKATTNEGEMDLKLKGIFQLFAVRKSLQSC